MRVAAPAAAPDETKARLAKRFATAGSHAASGVITDSLGRKWNPTLHPRDARGRFIEAGGIVSIWGGKKGRVLRTMADGKILVRLRDGRSLEQDPHRVTMLERPNGEMPTANKSKIIDEDDRRTAHPRRGNGVDQDDAGPDADQPGQLAAGPARPRPEPDSDAQPPRRFASIDQVVDNWAEGGDRDDLINKPPHRRILQQLSAELAGGRHSPQLSPGGHFLVYRRQGEWEIRHTGTGMLMRRSPTKHEGLAISEALEQVEHDHQPFSWDSDSGDLGLRMHKGGAGLQGRIRHAADVRGRELAAERQRTGVRKGPGAAAAKERGGYADLNRLLRERMNGGETDRRDYGELARRVKDWTETGRSDGSTEAWLKSNPDRDDVGAYLDRLAGTRRGSEQGTWDELRRMQDEIGERRGGRWDPRRRDEPAAPSPTGAEGDAAAAEGPDTEAGRAWNQALSRHSGDRDKARSHARKQAEAWRTQGHRQSGRGLTDTADERFAAADELEELADREPEPKKLPAPAKKAARPVRDTGKQEVPGGRTGVREDRAGVLGAVPAGQDSDDRSGAEGGVLREPRGAGGGRRRVPDRGQPEGVEQAGRPAGDEGAPGGDGEGESRAGGARRARVPAEGSRDRGALAQGPAPAAVRYDPDRQPASQARSESDRIGANLAALRTLRKVQAEQRPATPQEQAVLARWGGWGAIPQVFVTGNPKYQAARDEMHQLLSDDEYEFALQNTANAHYTDPKLVEAMWDGMRALGFNGGTVLEPGSGSGNFIGRAPDGTRVTGVERDPVTAAISQLLYPDADIRAESFGDTKIKPSSFDAVIGNVPFGNYAVRDKTHNPGNKMHIHDHFIVKGADALKPGGVMAVVTSRLTMDKQDSTVRRKLAEQSDLIGAVRLPAGTHKDTAGTDVVTDVLLLRKRKPGEAPGDQSWVDAPEAELADGFRARVNQYFLDHPDDVLGEMRSVKGQYGPDAGVVGDPKQAPQLMRGRLAALAEGAKQDGRPFDPDRTPVAPVPVKAAAKKAPAKKAPAAGDLRPEPSARTRARKKIVGQITHTAATAVPGKKAGAKGAVQHEFTQIDNSGNEVSFNVPSTQADELAAMMRLRDLRQDLIDAEKESTEDTAEVQLLRRQLSEAYDQYVRDFGPINRLNVKRTEVPAPKEGEDAGDDRISEGDDGKWYRETISRPQMGGARKDPTFWSVVGLEKSYDPETNTAEKASIFTQRQIAHRSLPDRADNPDDALTISLETDGKIDLPRIAGLLGIPEGQVREALGNRVFTDPKTGDLLTARKYLSGNVRRKFAEAKKAAEADPSLAGNVAALEVVVPTDKDPTKITAKLGTPWIPDSDFQQFVRDITGNQSATARRNSDGEWEVSAARGGGNTSLEGGRSMRAPRGHPLGEPLVARWGTGRRSTYELVQGVLRGNRPVVEDKDSEGKLYRNAKETDAAQTKSDQIEKEFSKWLWRDPSRAARLHAEYNTRFRSYTDRNYVDSPRRAYPGMSDAIELDPHQNDSVWMALESESVLLNHEVGTGKTFTMAATIMEKKRLGQVDKPIMVVPNHLLEQAAREFKMLYPDAQILATDKDSLAGTGQDSLAGKRRFVAQAASHDWDAVIMTKTAFKSMPLDESRTKQNLEDALQELKNKRDDALGDGNTAAVKRYAKQIQDREAKLKELNERLGRDEGGIDFVSAGFDYVVVDEAHGYKNDLVESSIKGLAKTDAALAAIDMREKLEYLRDLNVQRGKNSVALFASGTPVSNSTREFYVMARYLNPEGLREAGIYDFDDFARMHLEMRETVEPTVSGGIQVKIREGDKLVNTGELKRMMAQFEDVVTAADIGLERPKLKDGQAQKTVGRVSDNQAKFVEWLKYRKATLKPSFRPEKGDDTAVAIASDGLISALDLRLIPEHKLLAAGIDPASLSDEDSKVTILGDDVLATWRRTKDMQFTVSKADKTPHPNPGAAQLVFADNGVPKKDRHSFYQALKDYLVAGGMSPDEVAFIHDTGGDPVKDGKLMEQVRTGEVKVLIGSTEKMGTGKNVQNRLAKLHHADGRYRADEITQRNGRVIRRGNQLDEVEIAYYPLEGSTEGFQWGHVARKEQFLHEYDQADFDATIVGRDDDMGSEANFLMAVGNPLLMDKALIDTTLKTARNDRDAHAAAIEYHQDVVRRGGQAVQQLERDVRDLGDAGGRVQDTSGDAFSFTPLTGFDDDGTPISTRKDAAAALAARFAKMTGGYVPAGEGDLQRIGRLGGLELYARTFNQAGSPVSIEVLVGKPGTRPFRAETLNLSDLRLDPKTVGPNTLTRMENLVSGIPQREKALRGAIEKKQQEIATSKVEIGVPFEKADELAALETRSERLTDLMRLQASPGSNDADEAARKLAAAEVAYKVATDDWKRLRDERLNQGGGAAKSVEIGQERTSRRKIKQQQNRMLRESSAADRGRALPKRRQDDASQDSAGRERTVTGKARKAPAAPPPQSDSAAPAPVDSPVRDEPAAHAVPDADEARRTREAYLADPSDETLAAATGEPDRDPDPVETAPERESTPDVEPEVAPAPEPTPDGAPEPEAAPASEPEPPAASRERFPVLPVPAGTKPLADDPDDTWQRAMRDLSDDDLRAARDKVSRRAGQEAGPDRQDQLSRQAWLEREIERRGQVADENETQAREDREAARRRYLEDPTDETFEAAAAPTEEAAEPEPYEDETGVYISKEHAEQAAKTRAEQEADARRRRMAARDEHGMAQSPRDLEAVAREKQRDSERQAAEAAGVKPAAEVPDVPPQEADERAEQDAPAPDGPEPGGVPEAAPDPDAPEDAAEPQEAAAPADDFPDRGDVGPVTFEKTDRGLVLSGDTFPVKGKLGKAGAGFSYLQAPGDRKDRSGKPIREWRHEGAPEQQRAALQRLRDLVGDDGGTSWADEEIAKEKFPPTPQQQGVIDGVRSGQDVVVRALAGTGKTSTLEMVARRIPNKRVVYVAFNRVVADEARGRMPRNVESRTGDSISFTWAPKELQDKYDRHKKGDALIRNDQVAAHLGVTRPIGMPGGQDPLTPEEVAAHVKKTVENWAISADDGIGPSHVPAAAQPVAGQIVQLAGRAWRDIESPIGRLKITNSHLTKMWALSRPDLSSTGSGVRAPARVIFFDEAQDINPVMAKVIADQKLQKVYVGDSNQAIYAFRGAVDELDKVQAPHDLPLNKSWRFGPAVAEAGNRFLDLLEAPHRVEGGGGPSEVVPASTMRDADAILVRSNSGAVREILTEQGNGRLVGVPGGTKGDLINLAKTARWLLYRQAIHDREQNRALGDPATVPNVAMPNTLHDDLAPYRRWGEVAEAAEKTEDPKLTMLARIIDENGVDRLDTLAHQLVDLSDKKETRRPDVIVSTAHKSKGLEWDRVRIGADFRGPRRDKDTGDLIMPEPEELRLSYVAVTRAKKALDMGSLAWVTEHTGGHVRDVGHEDHSPDLPAVPDAVEAPGVPESRDEDRGDGALIDRGDAERDLTDRDNFLIAEQEPERRPEPAGPGEGQDGLFEPVRREAPERQRVPDQPVEGGLFDEARGRDDHADAPSPDLLEQRDDEVGDQGGSGDALTPRERAAARGAHDEDDQRDRDRDSASSLGRGDSDADAGDVDGADGLDLDGIDLPGRDRSASGGGGAQHRDNDDHRRRRHHRDGSGGLGGAGAPHGGAPHLPGSDDTGDETPAAGGAGGGRAAGRGGAAADGREAPFDQLLIAGRSPEDLDAMPWDDVAMLLADDRLDHGDLDNLLRYIDDRESRENGAVAGTPVGELAGMPDEQLAELNERITAPEDAARLLVHLDHRAAEEQASDAAGGPGGESLLASYARMVADKGKPRTQRDLRNEARDLNRAVVERKVAEHHEAGRVGNVDTIEALNAVLGDKAFNRAMLGRPVPASRVAAGQPDRRAGAAPGARFKLTDEDSNAWFGMLLADLEAYGRGGGEVRLPGLVDADDYARDYRAAMESPEAPDVDGPDAGSQFAADATPEAPGRGFTERDVTPEVESGDDPARLAERTGVFDAADGGWAAAPARLLRSGDMVRRGDDAAAREVLAANPGDRDGEPGTDVLVRGDAGPVNVFVPDGETLQVHREIGRTLDVGAPAEAAPGRPVELGRMMGWRVPAGQQNLIEGAADGGGLDGVQAAHLLRVANGRHLAGEVRTVDGRVLTGDLHHVGAGRLQVTGADGTQQEVLASQVRSVRLSRGGVSLPGRPETPEQAGEGTRVWVSLDGHRSYEGPLSRRGKRWRVDDRNGAKVDLPEGALVRPVTVHTAPDDSEGGLPAAGAGRWRRTPDGGMAASSPGEWDATVTPDPAGGVAWRVQERGRRAEDGHAEDEEAAIAAVRQRLGSPGSFRGHQVAPGGDTRKMPAGPPDPVGGRDDAAWTPTRDLTVGDQARVTGFASNGSEATHAGYVLNTAPVLVSRGGRPEPMMAVTVAENADGTGRRGVVLAGLDGLSARVPSQGDDQAADASTLSVLGGKLPDQVPLDVGGRRALYPGTHVREPGDNELGDGVVVAARADGVRVAWEGGEETDHAGGSLTAVDASARPPGWTADGRRVRVGQQVDGDAGAGTVASVDGDSVLLHTPAGIRDVPAENLHVRDAPGVDEEPDQVEITPKAAGDIAPGETVLLAGADGSLVPARVDEARAGEIEVTDLRDNTKAVVDTSTGEILGTIDGDLGDVGPARVPPAVTTGVDIEPVDGALVQPPMLTAQRQAVADLGLDLDSTGDPLVAQAAARLRAGRALTPEQVAALAGAVRSAGDAEGVPGGQARTLRRAAHVLDAARSDGPTTPPVEFAGGDPQLVGAADLGAGDMVAVPTGGGMLVGRVTKAEAWADGRLWHIAVESGGRSRYRTVTGSTRVWRLPDLEEPRPVDEPGDVPVLDDPGQPVESQEAADAVAGAASAAMLGAGTLAEARERAAGALTDEALAGLPAATAGRDAAGRDAARDAALRTINEAERLPGESEEAAVGRVAEQVLSAPDATEPPSTRPATIPATAAAAPEAAASAAPQLPQHAVDARDGRAEASIRDIERAVLRAAGARRGDLSASTRFMLLQLAENVVASRQQEAVLAVLAELRRGGKVAPGVPTRVSTGFKAVRGKLLRYLRDAFVRARDVSAAVKDFGERARRDVPEWDETRHLKRLLSGLPPDAGGEPADAAARAGHWMARLPAAGRFGQAQVRGRWYDQVDGDGRSRVASGVRWQLDRAEDGGPGVAALAHTDALLGLGRAVAGDVHAKVSVLAPDLGLDPRRRLTQAREAAEAADRAWRDASTRMDGATDRFEEAAYRARKESDRLHRLFAAAYSQAVQAAVAQHRPVGPGDRAGLDVGGRAGSPEVAAVRWAEQLLPRDWLAVAGPLDVRLGARGEYDPRGPRARVQVAPLDGEQVPGAGEYGASALHELGHHLAAALPDLSAAAWAYYWQRTSTGRPGSRTRTGLNEAQKLSRARPGHLHGDDELTRKDSFVDAYVGRDYGDEHEKLEFLPLALESLFAGSPYLDEGLEQWVLGVLMHLGRAEAQGG